MIVLTVDEILKLHEKLITATGGLSGIRDESTLHCHNMFCGVF